MKTSRMASLALLAGWSGLSMAGSHYVVPPGTPGVAPTPPYASWETAGTDLNAVVAAALAGSAPRTVLVTNGVYLLTNQVVVSGALTLASVNGAGVTVVDGNNHAGKPVTNRCFLLDAEGAVLRGFTIRNGYAVGADGGGGVCGKGSTSMLIEACRIVNCIATNGGDFYANGGGVCLGSQSVMRRCEVIGNTNFGAYGGGAYNAGGTITECLIASNAVHYAYNSAGSGTAEANGGGIMLSAGGTISNCTIIGNTTVRATGSTTGGRYGGGVRVAYGGQIFNTLIYGNSAPQGGGIWSRDTLTMQNCTVANNTGGVGIFCSNLANTTNHLQNLISRANTSGDLALNTSGYNYVRNGCFGTLAFTAPGTFSDNTAGNPLFEDAATGNYRLARGSPCINSGLNAAWMLDAFDLDGNHRIDRQSGRVDMGCFEYTREWGTVIRVK